MNMYAGKDKDMKMFMDDGHKKEKKSLSDYDKPKSVQAIDN